MELKEKIPHKAALLELVSEHISAITTAVQGEVGHLEAEYTRFRRYHRVSVLLISLAFLLPNLVVFVLGIYFTNLPLLWGYVIGILTGFVSLGFCGYYGGALLLKGYDVIQQFHKGVDKIIFSKVFDLFGVTGTLITHSITVDEKPLDEKLSKWRQLYEILRGHIHALKHSPESDRVLTLLAASELVTEPFNYTRIDNVFEISLADESLFVSELDVKNVVGSGKGRQEKNIFKGYFISYQLKRTCVGKTFISTEGDLHGFAHRTYWSGLTVGDVKEVVFKWSDFEHLLHVATSDEGEAREIISAVFMHDLYNWWSAQGTNIRISFIGDQMFMLFPDEQIRFEETITEINETKLQEYLLTVAEPLLNVLYLIEDIQV
jgi:Protein of unknown function (DUF3137)